MTTGCIHALRSLSLFMPMKVIAILLALLTAGCSSREPKDLRSAVDISGIYTANVHREVSTPKNYEEAFQLLLGLRDWYKIEETRPVVVSFKQLNDKIDITITIDSITFSGTEDYEVSDNNWIVFDGRWNFFAKYLVLWGTIRSKLRIERQDDGDLRTHDVGWRLLTLIVLPMWNVTHAGIGGDLRAMPD